MREGLPLPVMAVGWHPTHPRLTSKIHESVNPLSTEGEAFGSPRIDIERPLRGPLTPCTGVHRNTGPVSGFHMNACLNLSVTRLTLTHTVGHMVMGKLEGHWNTARSRFSLRDTRRMAGMPNVLTYRCITHASLYMHPQFSFNKVVNSHKRPEARQSTDGQREQ